MPTSSKVKILPPKAYAEAVYVEKIRRIWDPPPPYITKEYISEYIKLAIEFETRQRDLSQQLDNLEIQRMIDMGKLRIKK